MNSLRFYQIMIFAVGWIAYASTYFLRKPLGVIKADLEKDLALSTAELGWLDTALLFPYAFMQIYLGPLGDKYGPRMVFGCGLLCSALSMVFFGTFSNFYVFFILFFLNGTAQSQCWPNCTRGLLNWFPDSVKNSMFGMFGTCAFAGGVIGTFIAVYLQFNYGWQQVFMIPSLFVFAMGILVLLLFKQPEDKGIEVPGKAETSKPLINESQEKEKPKMMDLWRIPMIAEVSIAVFCLKVVRYCMYMWLPMYLLQALNYSKSQAGIFSTVFEVGGVTGSALIGFILDRFYKGRTLHGIALFCLISTTSLILFMFTSSMGVVLNSIFMFIAGAFNAGPDILLCGTVPLELVEKHNRNAAIATVGLVNGFGSIGTCIEGPIIGLVAAYTGWSGVFILIIALSILGTLVTYRAAFLHTRVHQSNADFIESSA